MLRKCILESVLALFLPLSIALQCIQGNVEKYCCGHYNFINNDCLAKHPEYFNQFLFHKKKDAHYPARGKVPGGLYFSYVLKYFLLLFLWIQSCLVGADLQVFCPKRLKHIETRQKDWYGQDSHLDWNGIPKCPGLVYFGNGSPDTGLLRKSWTTTYLKI